LTRYAHTSDDSSTVVFSIHSHPLIPGSGRGGSRPRLPSRPQHFPAHSGGSRGERCNLSSVSCVFPGGLLPVFSSHFNLIVSLPASLTCSVVTGCPDWQQFAVQCHALNEKLFPKTQHTVRNIYYFKDIIQTSNRRNSKRSTSYE